MRDVLIIGLFVLLAGLLAYQAYMLFWTKKTTGKVPRAVLVIRLVNIVLLVGGTVLIAVNLARG
ncbi:MAG: hypothetical protein JXA36_00440 [Coriobacteriia bacterium]|nr:hypothetical protein [Coriobacteriia bacterium]